MYRKKIFIIIILLGVGFGLFFVLRFYQIFFWDNTSFENKYSYIFIDSEDNIDSLAIKLDPILKSTSNFLAVAKKKGYSKSIRIGKYRIEKGMSNNDIINALWSQRLTSNVVFNNQERLQDLANRISLQIEADSLELITAFQDSTFLTQNGFTLENALSMYLPNSYNAFWDTTPEEFRNLMLKSYKRFWNKDRMKKVKKLGLTPNEVYILASIVYKETIKKDEQSIIAGLYLNRLRKRMKLQADPTVIYAKKKESNNFDLIIKRVLYKDLLLKSKYNTYRYRGLPPGPICMPDLSTIDSVLNPKLHTYLYFVASPLKPGYHLFAKNLREHKKNKKIYTQWLDKQNLYR